MSALRKAAAAVLAAPPCGLCLGTGDYGHDGDAECGCRDSVARAELRAALEATPTRPTVDGVTACLLRPQAWGACYRAQHAFAIATAFVSGHGGGMPARRKEFDEAHAALRAAEREYAAECARTIVQAEANEIDCDAEASVAARAMVDAWAAHDVSCECNHEGRACGDTLAALRRAAFALARHFPEPTL